MSNGIQLSIPCIEGNEWKYIKECLDTGWVSSSGKYVDIFEDMICKYTGANYAVACSNGTSALHLALLLADVKPDNEVIVPTLTFIAPVNAIKYVSASPLFMDCDEYYNIDIEKTIEFITSETYFKDGYTYNKKTEKKIAAIIPVHVFGNAVRLKELNSICIEKNIIIIEDATESLGTYYNKGSYKGKHTGTIGEFGCLSFNGNKIITTGGGGMLLIKDVRLAKRAKYLTTQAKDDDERYVHNDIGYNYRLSNIQAAMGVAQLEKLPKFLKIKKKNFNIYKEYIDKIVGLHVVNVPDYAENNHWMYALQLEKSQYGKSRDDVVQFLSNHNIQTRPVWHLNHLQKPYKNFQFFKIERALELAEKTLNLPCSTNLQKHEIEVIVELLKNG
jgi:aminotransferase in exopolysaccharide biosynthesis